jgi:hypothetical protein
MPLIEGQARVKAAYEAVQDVAGPSARRPDPGSFAAGDTVVTTTPMTHESTGWRLAAPGTTRPGGQAVGPET